VADGVVVDEDDGEEQELQRALTASLSHSHGALPASLSHRDFQGEGRFEGGGGSKDAGSGKEGGVGGKRKASSGVMHLSHDRSIDLT